MRRIKISKNTALFIVGGIGSPFTPSPLLYLIWGNPLPATRENKTKRIGREGWPLSLGYMSDEDAVTAKSKTTKSVVFFAILILWLTLLHYTFVEECRISDTGVEGEGWG